MRLALALLAVAASPTLALACAVCGAGQEQDRSQGAFLGTTILLSLLPLAMVGSFAGWLRHQTRERRRATPDGDEPTA